MWIQPCEFTATSTLLGRAFSFALWGMSEVALQSDASATFPFKLSRHSSDTHLLPLLCFPRHPSGMPDQWMGGWGEALVQIKSPKPQLCRWHSLWPWARYFSWRARFRISICKKGVYNIICKTVVHYQRPLKFWNSFYLFIFFRKVFQWKPWLCNPLSRVWGNTLKPSTYILWQENIWILTLRGVKKV